MLILPISLRSKKLDSIFLFWEICSVWRLNVRWYNYVNNIQIVCLDSQTLWVKENEITLDISTLKNSMASLQLVKNRLKRTHTVYLLCVTFCTFVHRWIPSVLPVTCNLEVANCVTHELAFLCSLAACYGPGGTMPSIESFREREHGPTTGMLNI